MLSPDTNAEAKKIEEEIKALRYKLKAIRKERWDAMRRRHGWEIPYSDSYIRELRFQIHDLQDILKSVESDPNYTPTPKK